MYYEVFLPVAIEKKLCYESSLEIKPGCRVLVALGSRQVMGICGEPEKRNAKLSYKSILEVFDEEPVIGPELLSLARWMSEYYHCSVGKILFTMLPAKLQISIESRISLCPDIANPAPEYGFLVAALDGKDSISLKEIKQLYPSYPVYRRALEAEQSGLITIVNKTRQKDKPKVQNYLCRTDIDIDASTLPLKQREAWELMQSKGHTFPMAEISNLVSYSTLRTLVNKGLYYIQARQVETPFSPEIAHIPPRNIVLNEQQVTAVDAILKGFGSFNVNLLFGITGSGKTEVYIEIIKKYIAKDQGVIFLIPEIALTPQMVERFDSAFGDILAIQHSQLTESQRLNQWQRIKRGNCRIVIGARSAIFAPLPSLGLIIVDEEHEQSYKQDNHPRYQGRDLAVMRAKLESAQIILGSATPALESWHNAQNGKYAIHTLDKRPLDFTLPTVKIVNMCDHHSDELLSDVLIASILERLERKEQVILFQNRRGFSSFMQCLKCGKLISCPNCDISMYYHRDREEMKCHYCGHFFPSPRKCPSCGSYSFSYGAPGTQKVEQILHVLFPTARIMRMDSDSSRIGNKTMYKRMKERDVDILLGTQMISKGLDFPYVTLVGIVLADISLNVPDFRSAERTFQLLTQVAGRSGRANLKGEVIIQTYNPDHYSIFHAAHQDYVSFAQEELAHRKELSYPPFYRLARVLFQSASPEVLSLEMQRIENKFANLQIQGLIVLGPCPAPFPKVNQLHRQHIILKAATPAVLANALAYFNQQLKLPAAVSMTIDVDPMSLL
ncbi:MAG TPA: primosomal protein N' [Candidatus Cloacimonadota bacterium]|nr:primosomal protein N' [Candidatus Cloacimonadota bacterium]